MSSCSHGVGADWMDGGAGEHAKKVADGLWGQGLQQEGPGTVVVVVWRREEGPPAPVLGSCSASSSCPTEQGAQNSVPKSSP